MDDDASATRTCPHCAEQIRAEAKVCKHCGRRALTPPEERRQNQTRLGVAVAAVVAGLTFFGWMVWSSEQQENREISEGRNAVCDVERRTITVATEAYSIDDKEGDYASSAQVLVNSGYLTSAPRYYDTQDDGKVLLTEAGRDAGCPS